MVRTAKAFWCFLRRLMSALSLLAAVSSATAQEGKTQWLPRNEMIGVIIGLAASEGCGKLDGVRGALFEGYCKDPTVGFTTHMLAGAVLNSQPDEALIELCRKHRIFECETQEETSRGRPVLVFDATIRLRAHLKGATWSPDNRFLLLDYVGGKRGARVLDLSTGQLSDRAIGGGLDASAWSPDSKYLAVIFGESAYEGQAPPIGGIRVLSGASLEEVGTLPASKEGCRFRGQRLLAFTTDSKSLWVGCSAHDTSSAAVVKLKVPKLEIEDELLVSPPSGVLRALFRVHAITRDANDLILSGVFYPRDVTGMAHGNGAVAAFSLTRKLPIYPAFFPGSSFNIIRHAEDSSLVLLHSVQTGRPADPKGDPPRDWKLETWDTRSRERIGAFGGTTEAGTYVTLPVPIPQSNVLIAAVGARKSPRKNLIVIDDRTGALLQEIGPIPTVTGVVVSPDGSRAAIFGSEEIRIYKVAR